MRTPMQGTTEDYPIELFDASLVGSPIFYGGTHVDVVQCGFDSTRNFFLSARIGTAEDVIGPNPEHDPEDPESLAEIATGQRFVAVVNDIGAEMRIEYRSDDPIMRRDVVLAALAGMEEDGEHPYTANRAGHLSWTTAGLLKYVAPLFVARRIAALQKLGIAVPGFDPTPEE
jgi:hypothetical protein